MQPYKPVGLQYSGAPQSAEALGLSNPQAPLRFTSRALTQPSASVSNLVSSCCQVLTRALGRLLHSSKEAVSRLGEHIAISSSWKYSSWERRASSAPLLRRIAIAARVWRREAIVIVFPCLSTVPTCMLLLM